MQENNKVTEDLYVEPTVEVSGAVFDDQASDEKSITICGCCLC